MNRIILKFSGEALKDNNLNVSNDKLEIIFKTIKLLLHNNYNVAVVIGGGNFFRGREHPEMNKVTADTIGMLGTVMNSLYLKDYLESKSIECYLDTPFDFPNLLPNYDKDELKKHYNKGKIIVFGGGVGLSGYSTDSGTILAANKIDADLIIKMTNVDGVYDKDPDLYPDAIKYDKLSFDEVLDKKLGIMDEYAILECKKKNIKIKVMNFLDYEKILDNIGTMIEE